MWTWTRSESNLDDDESFETSESSQSTEGAEEPETDHDFVDANVTL